VQALSQHQAQARRDRAQLAEELQREAAAGAMAAREAGHAQALLDMEPRMGEVRTWQIDHITYDI
jgi:hypothetical protein